MTRVAIRRISRINDYRAFQGWVDQSRPDEFRRVNLIYGTNGSGKSTLGALMRECAEPDLPTPRVGMRLELSTGASGAVVDENDASFWPRVKVFNTDYVSENLGFEDAAGPSPDSLLTLGKPNLDAQKELKESEHQLAELEPKLGPARQDASATSNQLEARLTSIAGAIVGDLRNSPVARYRATNTYTKAQVRQVLLSDAPWTDSASMDIGADLALAISSAKPLPALLGRGELASEGEVEMVRELLARDVVSQAMESLRDHADRAGWVQEGMALHAELDECLFCGQPLTARCSSP